MSMCKVKSERPQRNYRDLTVISQNHVALPLMKKTKMQDVFSIIIKFRYNARSDWSKQRALSEYRCTE